MKTAQNLLPKSMVQHPIKPKYPIKSYDQNMESLEIWTTLGQFHGVIYENSSEFSAKNYGTTSDNARLSHKMLRPKHAWKVGDSNCRP